MFKQVARFGAIVSALLLTGIAAGTAPARAGDDMYMVSIADAMATSDWHEKIDGSVKFYFGDQAHPAVQKQLGNYVANEKTNGFAKSSETACTWALLSALVKFQRRAQQLGANAVINIHSYYKRRDYSSETQVQCYNGFLMSGVALKGDFVRIH
jgi:uncharacterized protein YbjQ (UPF0145 family)